MYTNTFWICAVIVCIHLSLDSNHKLRNKLDKIFGLVEILTMFKPSDLGNIARAASKILPSLKDDLPDCAVALAQTVPSVDTQLNEGRDLEEVKNAIMRIHSKIPELLDQHMLSA